MYVFLIYIQYTSINWDIKSLTQSVIASIQFISQIFLLQIFLRISTRIFYFNPFQISSSLNFKSAAQFAYKIPINLSDNLGQLTLILHQENQWNVLIFMNASCVHSYK